MIYSKALDLCDAFYIFCNYYRSLKKEWYEKSDYFIDDYDDDDDDDDDYDADDGFGNNLDVITDF